MTDIQWRKSSRSVSNGACVEMAYADAARWRKSSRSVSNGECVEVAYAGLVRDSKNPSGPVLAVGRRSFAVFVDAVKADRFGS